MNKLIIIYILIYFITLNHIFIYISKYQLKNYQYIYYTTYYQMKI